MRARDHLDAKLLALGLQKPAGAAIGVKHKQALIGAAILRHGGGNRFGDLLGVKVQIGGQALQIHVIPAVLPFQRQHLMRQGPASDQQDPALMTWRQANLGQRAVVQR